jgi:hypothetical protein
MGLKCDVGLKSGAKFNANACMVKGPLALGGALCLDTGKGQLSKFELGAQYDVTPASTLTGMLLDSGSDLKVSSSKPPTTLYSWPVLSCVSLSLSGRSKML